MVTHGDSPSFGCVHLSCLYALFSIPQGMVPSRTFKVVLLRFCVHAACLQNEMTSGLSAGSMLECVQALLLSAMYIGNFCKGCIAHMNQCDTGDDWLPVVAEGTSRPHMSNCLIWASVMAYESTGHCCLLLYHGCTQHKLLYMVPFSETVCITATGCVGWLLRSSCCCILD